MSKNPYGGATLGQAALGDEVSQVLRTAIITGRLSPGSRLIESAIASNLGVSRGPVRDALRILETEGLVSAQPRRGSTVAVFSRQDVEEIFSLRAELEGLASRWAAARMDDVVLRQLQRTHSRILKAAPDPAKLIDRDLEFHRLVVHASGHQRVIEAWHRLEPQILYFRYRTRNMFVNSPTLAHRHDRVMQAFLEKDSDAAELAMKEHIEIVRVRALESWAGMIDGADAQPAMASTGS